RNLCNGRAPLRSPGAGSPRPLPLLPGFLRPRRSPFVIEQLPAPSEDDRVVVRVRDLKKYFELKAGFLQSLRGHVIQVHAVDGIGFDLHQGEILALVDKSGCGTTTTRRPTARLAHPTEGT